MTERRIIRGGPGDPDLTWTCHVCGDERPDVLIAVFKDEAPIGGGATMGANVRYCRDRPGCRDGAPAIARRWLAVAS